MQRTAAYSNLWLWKTLFITIIVLSCPKTSLAKDNIKTIRLYKENGSPVSDYNQQISNILEASKENMLPIRVQFSNGMSVVVRSVRHGNQNLILDIGDNKVLRIRISKYRPLFFWNALINPSAMVDSMSQFLNGYKVLKEHNIPLPEMTLVSEREREFLILEKLNIEFLYADYLNPKFVEELPLEERKKIDRDFLDFAKKTFEFRNFGDFSSTQLAYTKDRGWVLFDFSSNHELHVGTKGNVFEFDMHDEITNKHSQYSSSPQEIIRKPGLPAHLKDQVRNIIQIMRNEIPQPQKSCSSIFNKN